MNTPRRLCRAFLVAAALAGSGGYALAQTPPSATPPPPRLNFFQRLQAQRISLRRDISGPLSDEAATFSFRNTVGAGTVSSADFALRKGFRPVTRGATTFSPVLSLEGHVSSDESESEDAWRLRVSSEIDAPLGRRSSYYALASLKFEGDRDLDTQKLVGEFFFTPTVFGSFLGQAYPTTVNKPNSPIRFRLRPIATMEAGRTLKKGASAETNDTVLRLLLRAKSEVFLPGVTRFLGIEDVFLYADNAAYYLPLENEQRTHNFFVTGIEFRFSEVVSLGLVYKNGESAPNFHKIETFGATIGVRF